MNSFEEYKRNRARYRSMRMLEEEVVYLKDEINKRDKLIDKKEQIIRGMAEYYAKKEAEFIRKLYELEKDDN